MIWATREGIPRRDRQKGKPGVSEDSQRPVSLRLQFFAPTTEHVSHSRGPRPRYSGPQSSIPPQGEQIREVSQSPTERTTRFLRALVRGVEGTRQTERTRERQDDTVGDTPGTAWAAARIGGEGQCYLHYVHGHETGAGAVMATEGSRGGQGTMAAARQGRRDAPNHRTVGMALPTHAWGY